MSAFIAHTSWGVIAKQLVVLHLKFYEVWLNLHVEIEVCQQTSVENEIMNMSDLQI